MDPVGLTQNSSLIQWWHVDASLQVSFRDFASAWHTFLSILHVRLVFRHSYELFRLIWYGMFQKHHGITGSAVSSVQWVKRVISKSRYYRKELMVWVVGLDFNQIGNGHTIVPVNSADSRIDCGLAAEWCARSQSIWTLCSQSVGVILAALYGLTLERCSNCPFYMEITR